MGQVNFIRSSRKQWKCQKCGTIINRGDSYYRGEVNFGPVFIRCSSCKLNPWEVTTSEWTRQVGELINTWPETYSWDEDGVYDIISAIESIRDMCDDNLSNIPDQLQDANAGQLLQDRIEACEYAISDLEEIDFDDLKSDSIEEWWEPEDDEDCPYDYDTAVQNEVDGCDRLVEIFEGKLYDEIDEALNQLDI